MASFIHLIDQRRLIGPGGSTVAGDIFFYYTGTSVLAPIYQDANMNIPSPNPVQVGAGEIVPSIFLDDSIVYRRVIVYSDGTYDEQDPLGTLFSEGEIGLPVGAVIDYSGPTAPEGFMFCAGQAISRIDFLDLFTAIGTTYGSGNGTTTFNLPDFRGRVLAGKDNMGGVSAGRITNAVNHGIVGTSLGSSGGSQGHSLIEDELAVHDHGVTDAGHAHDYGVPQAGGTGIAAGAGFSSNTGITATAVSGLIVNNAGMGTAHNNVQPTSITNKIIKVLPVTFLSLLAISPDFTNKANAAAIGITPVENNLGIGFSSIIAANSTVKQALIALENAEIASQASLRHRISLRDMGAVGDGISDDTAAIQAWLALGNQFTELWAPVGKYRFVTPLATGAVDNLLITGSSKLNSLFWYDGADTTVNMFTVGVIGTSTHVTLRGFSVDRMPGKPAMTAGYAIVINDTDGGFEISDVNPGNPGNTPLIWDAILFDRTNVGFYSNFIFRARNNGIVMKGSAVSDQASDLFLDKGLILGGNYQIYSGGGFGGLYLGQLLCYGGNVGLRIDTVLVNRYNREVLISSLCCLDAQDQAHIWINQTYAGLQLNVNGWLSGAGYIPGSPGPGDGIRIENAFQCRISIDSGHIKSAIRHAVRIEDASTEILIADDVFITDSLWGVFATVSTENVIINAQVRYNTAGNIHTNVQAYKTYSVTPTATAGAGWAFTGTIKCRLDGQSVKGFAYVTCTTLGTASGALFVPLPFPIKTPFVSVCRNDNSAAGGTAIGDAATSAMLAFLYNGGFPFGADGQTLRAAFEYEPLY